MAQDTASPREVHAAYLETRGWAQGASGRQLRRRVQRWRRHLARLDPMQAQDDLARLRAAVDELADRGVPS